MRIHSYLKKLKRNRVKLCLSVDWDLIKCSTDPEQRVPEGNVPIGRFPWLGVIQHTFYMGGKARYAVTSGTLIHPVYAIAAAEDIARIPRETILNNTKFILWHSETTKYAIEVQDYLLHPEYEEKVTFATLALVELITNGETGFSSYPSVVLPICLPLSGAGTYDQLFSVRITDDGGELHKEATKVNYVGNKDCEEYYYQKGLTYEMMKPRRPLCAVATSQGAPCVWDAGSVLITRQSWGHWMIIAFSMRGPGCGAPARYVTMHDFLPWIDDVITKTNPDEQERTVKMYFRRQSPVAFTMYSADLKIPKEHGQCSDKKARGGVLFKESSEVFSTKNFGQGFYYMSVLQAASVMCVQVSLEVTARTNAAVWIEHMCHRDVTGLHYSDVGPDFRKLECFMFFKSKAYVEVRFFFSFRAEIEVTIYGRAERGNKIMPNPFEKYPTTIPWRPTQGKLNWYRWKDASKWEWHL
ncbi:uncharacterized protein LOC132902738 [Amyelois transitella]|uniref:uncharacterized protein LOC132902738 n=1 Tax=Amyelois transitella TaxID=680683 RepID=UPI0029905F53|nr:uncharacterized protein LOC132902738 [Amyelois transitella]